MAVGTYGNNPTRVFRTTISEPAYVVRFKIRIARLIGAAVEQFGCTCCGDHKGAAKSADIPHRLLQRRTGAKTYNEKLAVIAGAKEGGNAQAATPH